MKTEKLEGQKLIDELVRRRRELEERAKEAAFQAVMGKESERACHEADCRVLAGRAEVYTIVLRLMGEDV